MSGRTLSLAQIAAAMRAGRIAISENIAIEVAAERCGASPESVKAACVILRFGDASDIEGFESGKLTMRSTLIKVRGRVPLAERKKGRRVSQRSSKKEVERRLRNLAAARVAINEGLGYRDAIERAGGGSLHRVGEAYLVLKHGTPEEIAILETGGNKTEKIARAIRQRIPREERRTRVKEGRAPVNQTKREQDAAIWDTLKTALGAITSLPQPIDVVDAVRRNAMRATHVDSKLLTAHQWMTEFSDAWTK